ncbi:MAG TPA: MMPL family transporter, partial [Gaiellaceae bacterium]
MLARLAHFIVRRRRWVIGSWIALTLFGAFSATQVSKRWFQSFSIPGYSAYEANKRTIDRFGTGMQAPLVVVFQSKGDVTKVAGLEQAVTKAAAIDKGARTSSYWSTGSSAFVSKDGHTAFAEIYPPGEPTFSSSTHIKQVRAALKSATPKGVTAYLTGRDALEEASSGGGKGPSVLTEGLIGGGGALVILFFVFGTLPAVLMPIAIAIAAILNTYSLVWALTYVTNVS